MGQKLIFLDIDGTILVPGEGIRRNLLDGLSWARSQGHLVFISTGRSHTSLPKELDVADLDGVIASAGSDIWIRGQNVWRTSIPEELLHRAFPILERAGAVYILENYDKIYISGLGKRMLTEDGPAAGDNPELARWKAFFRGRIDICYLDEWNPKEAPVAKVAFFVWEKGQAEQIARELGEDFYVAMFQPGSRKFLNGELISKTDNKGTAIHRIASFFGAAIQDTVAFGDSMNDRQMLEAAGIGIAMGNADERLKAIADRICEPVEEDGVLRELKRMKIL